MTDMLTRVAQAIGETVPGREQMVTPWTMTAARAAIEALREPSEAMLNAGPPEPYMDRDTWRAIIDAALGEAEK